MSNAVWLPGGTNVRLYRAVLVILPKYSLCGIVACRKKFMAWHTLAFSGAPDTGSRGSGQDETNCKFISVCKNPACDCERRGTCPILISAACRPRARYASPTPPPTYQIDLRAPLPPFIKVAFKRQIWAKVARVWLTVGHFNAGHAIIILASRGFKPR